MTAGSESGNGALAPGASVSFGFLASWNGANSVPVATCGGA